MDWLILLVFLYSDGWGSHHHPIAQRFSYDPEFYQTPFDCSEYVDNVLEQQYEGIVDRIGENPQWIFIGCVTEETEDYLMKYFEEKYRNHGKSKNSE